MVVSSKIFSGYRALGFTSNQIPLAVRYHHKHKEHYVVTCVGKSFHTYNLSKLGIISVSDAQAEPISSLAVDDYLVYTSCGKVITAFVRGRQIIHVYEGHDKDVHLLLPFGGHLVSVDESSCVKVWDIKTQEVYTEVTFDNVTFRVTAVMHPSTYLNKVLFGSKQGRLQLWNIKTNKLLFTFPGWDSPVTVLQQAPAVDVAAVGLEDGRIFLHNLRFDETVLKFSQDWGPVTALSFRTDGHPVMASGSTIGHISLWDLEDRKLLSHMPNCHQGAVCGMYCLPSEPLMVTSSSDNSIKVWIFDQPDGSGRLLRQRLGHSAPPSRVRFHGQDGQNILSAGQDSTLQSFSTKHDSYNRSLGRASFNKTETKKSGLKQDRFQMPPIVEFSSESGRESDWDGIAACHRGLCMVTTWNYQRSTMGQHKLQHERFPEGSSTVAQCVTITSCGNFVLIGYSSGHVDVYNLQSGLHRGSYGNPTAHDGAVRGIATDSLNQLTISAGADSSVKFWRFKQKNLLYTLKLESCSNSIYLHRESCMLAIARDNFTVCVVDAETRRVVRNFTGHSNRITDMAFSPDGRWLITASMDSTVRTWHLPSASLIDCFSVDMAVTSLSMSPLGNFLVTSHVDDLGVYLWSNMALYTYVPLQPLPADYEPQVMALPSTQDPQTVEELQTTEWSTLEEDDLSEYKSPEQISDELVTLSLLPGSRWLGLFNLDIIKQRNRPKQPPKVPKSAPFFLPTIPGLQPKFAQPVDDDSEKLSHVSTLMTSSQTVFCATLLKTEDEDRFEKALEMLKEMGPSKIDMEVRCLSPEGGGSIELMRQFIHFIRHILNTGRDFELAQAYLAMFLKLHGNVLSAEPSLLVTMETLREVQKSSWSYLQESLNTCLGLLNYLKTATL